MTMQIEEALEKNPKVKFKAPILKPYIERLEAIENSFPIPRTEVEIDFQALWDLDTELREIAQDILEKVVEEDVCTQMDNELESLLGEDD